MNYIVGEGQLEYIPIAARIEVEMGHRPSFSNLPRSTSAKEDYSRYFLIELCRSAGFGTLTRTLDASKIDLTYIPNKITHDIHLAMQTKHTHHPKIETRGRGESKYQVRAYRFKIKKKRYHGQLMIFHSLEDNKIWMIPFDILYEKYKGDDIYICDPPGKEDIFSKFEVNINQIAPKIHHYYQLLGKTEHLQPVTKKDANTCESKSSQIECDLISELSKYVPLEHAPIQGLTYDTVLFPNEFPLKTQSKTAWIASDSSYRVKIERSPHLGNMGYRDGDFDVLHIGFTGLTKAFFFPIGVLIEKGYIYKVGKQQTINLTLYPIETSKINKTRINNSWTEEFLVELTDPNIRDKIKSIIKKDKN